MLRLKNVQLSSNLLLSPIAGYCDLAFRLTVRPLGGLALASSDLINPRGLLRQTRKSLELVETEPADQPLCIQLYGHEPDEMANAAQWSEENGAVVIDINMGCPVDKVCKKHGGSALLRDPKRAAELARKVVRAVNAPVTVKMRLGWDPGQIVAPQIAAALEDVGVAGVTIHGRTAAQKFSGKASLEGIARVVEAVKRVPVIGNGDICHPHDAKHMLDYTGCAGVMIGRAALSDPWLFRHTHAYLTTGHIPPPPTSAERTALMNTHFGHLMRIRGERLACMTFRQRVSWYIKKLPACPQFRERIRFIQTADEYHACIESLHSELTTAYPPSARQVA